MDLERSANLYDSSNPIEPDYSYVDYEHTIRRLNRRINELNDQIVQLRRALQQDRSKRLSVMSEYRRAQRAEMRVAEWESWAALPWWKRLLTKWPASG